MSLQVSGSTSDGLVRFAKKADPLPAVRRCEDDIAEDLQCRLDRFRRRKSAAVVSDGFFNISY
jgi:hypothetical protein